MARPKQSKRARKFWKISLRWIFRTTYIALVLLTPRTACLVPSPPSETAQSQKSDAVTTAVYSTKVGEHRQFILPDGSTVDLNSQSRISITFSPEARSVVLATGEALFYVKHEARPFTVRSGCSVIEDVATAFNVYKRRRSTVVSVVEGRIKIYSVLAATSHPVLDAGSSRKSATGTNDLSDVYLEGQQVELSDDADTPARVRKGLSAEDLSGLMAWREGRIDFNEQPLADAVEEFGRYHTEKLQLSDQALGKLHVNGNLFTNSLAEFLEMLRIEFQIQSKASTASDGSTVITLSPIR
jgi:transmembrane sensor